jgi:hypothetical protein
MTWLSAFLSNALAKALAPHISVMIGFLGSKFLSLFSRPPPASADGARQPAADDNVPRRIRNMERRIATLERDRRRDQARNQPLRRSARIARRMNAG